jgi:hypothetical protein
MEEIKYFFSYARKDSEFVLRLATDLRKVGVNLWLDQLDILGGQLWDRAVQGALEACQGMIAVLSPDALASNNVMDEVSYALDEGKLVVPILLLLCDLPYRLRRVHNIDFTTSYSTGFSLLLRTLHIDQPPQPAGPAALEELQVRNTRAPSEGVPKSPPGIEHLPLKTAPPASEKQPSQDSPSMPEKPLETESYLPTRRLSYWKALGLRLLLGCGLLHVDETLRKAAGNNTMAQATTVVALSSIAAGVGNFAQGGFPGIIVFTGGTFLGWFVWAYLTYFIGTRLLPEPQTKANLVELLRAIGFSSSPGLIRVLGIIPGWNQIVSLVSGLWMLVAMVIAVRRELDYTGIWRAIAVCVIGWIVQLLLLVLLFLALDLNPWA